MRIAARLAARGSMFEGAIKQQPRGRLVAWLTDTIGEPRASLRDTTKRKRRGTGQREL
jgi:hypothetical protein